MIPWDELARIYAKHLDSGAGRESVDLRMVIGALIIKHKLSLTDRDTVLMISENISEEMEFDLRYYRPAGSDLFYLGSQLES